MSAYARTSRMGRPSVSRTRIFWLGDFLHVLPPMSAASPEPIEAGDF
jgi:hypothetical protein